MRRSKEACKMLGLSFASGSVGALLVYLAMTYLPAHGRESGARMHEVIADNTVSDIAQPARGVRGASTRDSAQLAQLAGSRLQAGYIDNEVNNIEVYEETNQAVVNITARKETQVFSWFFEPIPREDEAFGSGSIIDAAGYILTNNHVVQNASKVQVTLYDGSQFTGEIAGSDPENDLAIVRFAPKGRRLSTIRFVENDKLQVGQKVFAIGNPYGFERTLTVGIVSGLGRPIQNENGLVIQGMIQTDASINPGNSGGPLLNSRGQMIGVNSSIYSPTGSSVGLGFAVPVSTVRRVLPDLIKYGTVRRGWIDMKVIPLFPQLVRYKRLPVEKGLLVSEVLRGSEADKAGLQGGQRSQAVRSGKGVIYLGGDIITQIGDIEVSSMADLYSALEPTHPGDKLQMTVYRDGKKREFEIRLSERKRN